MGTPRPSNYNGRRDQHWVSNFLVSRMHYHRDWKSAADPERLIVVPHRSHSEKTAPILLDERMDEVNADVTRAKL